MKVKRLKKKKCKKEKENKFGKKIVEYMCDVILEWGEDETYQKKDIPKTKREHKDRNAGLRLEARKTKRELLF